MEINAIYAIFRIETSGDLVIETHEESHYDHDMTIKRISEMKVVHPNTNYKIVAYNSGSVDPSRVAWLERQMIRQKAEMMYLFVCMVILSFFLGLVVWNA